MKHAMTCIGLALASAGLAFGAPTTLPSGIATDQSSPSGPERIIIDGDHSDWAGDRVAIADGEWVYLRFWVGQERDAQGRPLPQPALQASEMTLTILLDLDGDSFTGVRPVSPDVASDLGVDLEIHLSPRRNDGRPGSGVEVFRYSPEGRREQINHAKAGFHIAPTYGSQFYEAKIARSVLDDFMGAPQAPESDDALDIVDLRSGALQAGVGGGIILMSIGEDLIRYTDPFIFDLPARSDSTPSGGPIPQKEPTTLRVMSWNVLWGEPKKEPEKFARVFKALKPDIVLLQEWERAPVDGADIASWFNANLGGSWSAVGGPLGVGIASPHPIVMQYNDPVVPADGENNPMRISAALVQTPLRDTLAASLHLKCCGSAGSSEDVRRMMEAEAVRSFFMESAPEWQTFRVVGGDINLVGSREPLEILKRGIDEDGSDLLVSAPLRKGSNTMYSWRDTNTRFSPGRLDYILVGDASAVVIRSFILDTQLLSDASLEKAGLQRGDTDGSDHLPVIVDYQVRPEPEPTRRR